MYIRLVISDFQFLRFSVFILTILSLLAEFTKISLRYLSNQIVGFVYTLLGINFCAYVSRGSTTLNFFNMIWNLGLIPRFQNQFL